MIKIVLRKICINSFNWFFPKKQRCSLPSWKVLGCAVRGERHTRSGSSTPCQDAFCIQEKWRPSVIVCDGAGSSEFSQIASRSISDDLLCWIQANPPCLQKALDRATYWGSEELPYHILQRCAATLQKRSESTGLDVRLLRTTLSLFIVGKSRCLWLCVGDSPLCVRQTDKWLCLNQDEKGEFASSTNFLELDVKRTRFKYGFIPTDSVNAGAVFTDGTAERLLGPNSKVAPAVDHMISDLLACELHSRDLEDFLNSSNVWKTTSGDDRTLVLLARKED